MLGRIAIALTLLLLACAVAMSMIGVYTMAVGALDKSAANEAAKIEQHKIGLKYGD